MNLLGGLKLRRALPIIKEVDLRMEGLEMVLVVDKDSPRHGPKEGECFGRSAAICHPYHNINITQAVTERPIEEAHTRTACPGNDYSSVAEF